jgi:DNA-binding NtrC family response regulator
VLSPGAIELLRQYGWPGNIREFRNVMESMLLTARDRVLTEADLPLDRSAPAGAALTAPDCRTTPVT